MSKILQVRMFYRDADYEMVRGWWLGHKVAPVSPLIMPRLGIVIYEEGGRDLAALWLYMDNSVGVCFLEHSVTRTGISLADSSAALHFGIEYLKQEAARLNYGIMLLRCIPSIARYARKNGFTLCETGVSCLSCRTGLEEVAECLPQ